MIHEALAARDRDEAKDRGRDSDLLCPPLILLRLKSTCESGLQYEGAGLKGIVHIIEIQRQEATSIKTSLSLSLSSALMPYYLLNSPSNPIKTPKASMIVRMGQLHIVR